MTSGEDNKLNELTFFKIVFDEMLRKIDSTNEKQSQNAVSFYKRLNDYKENVIGLNKVLSSMMNNNKVKQIFENQWIDLSKNQKNITNWSKADISDIFSQCMISLQFSKDSKGKENPHYHQACGFLKNSQCSDLLLIDFNKLTSPNLDSKDENDYNGICRLNSSFDGILDKATKEFHKNKTICGQKPEVIFNPR